MRIPTMIVILALTVPAGLLASESVIVHPKTPAADLSQDELRSLFLGKKTSWDDGTKIVVVTLKDGASQDGLMKLLGKSASQFNTAWKKIVFTGHGSIPEQLDSEDEMVAFVAKTPGAIAFVDSSKVKGAVKALPLK